MGFVYKNQKIPTNIWGLDRLLFGGIQLQSFDGNNITRPLVIMIEGEPGSSRALFAMQLLHGLCQSLYSMQEANYKGFHLTEPIYFSPQKKENNLHDMLLDTLISKCINKITLEHIIDEHKWNGNEFCRAIFQLDNNTQIAGFDPLMADLYLTEGALNYNNRTNALHYTIPYNPEDPNCIANTPQNFIAQRRYDQIEDYVSDFQNLSANNPCSFLKKEFFNITIRQKLDMVILKNEIGEMTNFPARFPCIVLDGIDYSQTENQSIIDFINEKTLIVIHIVEDGRYTQLNPDLIIKMRCHEDTDSKYMTYQMRFIKSTLQTTALGWHQYKKRDDGIEIYPSTHVLLQRRRHMPKSLSRGCMNAFTDTYQQFIDRKERQDTGNFHYKKYEKYRESACSNNLKLNFQIFHDKPSTYSALQDILINDCETSGLITTIIGPSNSYKRFLSLGSVFSAACKQQQSLYILLDQEPDIMQRRIVCPAWSSNASSINPPCISRGCRQTTCVNCQECKLHECESCYKNIHFWDLRMGNIKPDEFFYYLIKQISALRSKKGANLKRIVIDDIQKIEYSFPLLRKDPLFLTTLISICKDYKIKLLILCDKNASLMKELRTLSDNVVCTERVKKESRFYIERYAGYNSPSHIFGCKIQKIENLFLCETHNGHSNLFINEICIDPIYVPNMDHYWVCNDTNKLIDHLK